MHTHDFRNGALCLAIDLLPFHFFPLFLYFAYISFFSLLFIVSAAFRLDISLSLLQNFRHSQNQSMPNFII